MKRKRTVDQTTGFEQVSKKIQCYLVRQVITRNVGAIVHLVPDCYGLKVLRVALNGEGHKEASCECNRKLFCICR